MAPLPAPVNVAPLIKFSRWGLLLAGVVYGMGKHSRYSSIENQRRAEDEKMKDVRNAKLVAEQKRRAEEELRSISDIVGGKI